MQQSKDQLPVGYRFSPTEGELVGHYLFKKLKSSSLLPFETILVADSNLYDKDEPWQLWEKSGARCSFNSDDHEIYLFTPLKKKRSRILRSVGDGGTWHGVDSGKPVKARIGGGQWIKGMKKTFNYRNPKSIHDGCWIMHEFSLFDVSSDWVLCRLKKNFVTDDQKGCEITKRISWKNRKIVNSDGECDKRLMIADVAIAEQPALSDFSFNGASVLVVAEQGDANTAGADFNSEMVPSDNGLQAETIVAEGEVLPEVNSNEGDQLLGHEIVEWAHNSSSMINTDLTFSNGEQSGDDQSFYADLESLNQSDSFLAYLLEDDDMPSKFGSR